jgi:predicted Zn-dependent protease with MMP-like domain
MDEPIADETFEDWVFDALDALPAPFRERLGSVAVVIEEWPSPEQLRSVHAMGLFGLYQGVPRSALSADHAAIPSKITIFRGPLLRSFPTREAVHEKVIDTVRHEVAHHLGISDARLHELAEAASHGAADPGPGR